MKRFIIPIIFLSVFSLTLFLWNRDQQGRWSDEQGIMEHGYILTRLIQAGDFGNSFWYTFANDHPPFAYYLYGIASYKDFLFYDMKEPPSWYQNQKGAPIFDYDLHFARLIPLFASLFSVLLVFFIGQRYFSRFIGITAALILATLPHFVGYSQYVDLESLITFFFTSCVFTYLLFLETKKKRFLLLTGILAGITLNIKESNILIYVFYGLCFFSWKYITKDKKIFFSHFYTLILFSVITCFALWPMVWFHPIYYFEHINSAWLAPSGLTPDVFFGKYMGAHFYYYFFVILVTTPVVILLLLATGLLVSIKIAIKKNKKEWVYTILMVWFITPFFMIFFHHRQHMVRYIIEVYAPLSILSAVGLSYGIKYITANKIFAYLIFFPILCYSLFILSTMSPYYLTYFNELVGGTKNVYDKQWFLINWFGEGLKNPGIYLAKHAHRNATVGLAINPYTSSSIYKIPSIRYEQFDPKKSYDYVVVNYYNIIRMQFNEKQLEKEYTIIYTEKAAGINLVQIYKHK